MSRRSRVGATTRSSCARSAITRPSAAQSKSAACDDGAHTSARSPIGAPRPRTSCSTASTTVVVLPVPGGPHTRYGALRARPSTMAHTARHCSGLLPTFGLKGPRAEVTMRGGSSAAGAAAAGVGKSSDGGSALAARVTPRWKRRSGARSSRKRTSTRAPGRWAFAKSARKLRPTVS
eukprot:scaffold57086_cov59-Phaeocystis_antarctica.AAC.2